MSEFHYEKVKDPTYFSENRVAAHSDHRYFTSLAAMEQESLGRHSRAGPYPDGRL